MSASRISIATQPTSRADALAAVRAVTGRAIGEIKQQLATGAPLLEGELWSTDEFDDKARRLVAELEAMGVPVRIQLGTRTITPEVLANMFKRHADELERQGELMNEEAEE